MLRTQSLVHFAMAEFFCSAKPFQFSTNTLAPKSRAISQVWSVLPESTMTISSAQRTLSNVRGRFASSLNVMMATERPTAERINADGKNPKAKEKPQPAQLGRG